LPARYFLIENSWSNIMEQADLLYSGLIVTALALSLWTGALLAAACIFFAPSFFTPRPNRPSSHKP
jgi:hypothetical protein